MINKRRHSEEKAAARKAKKSKSKLKVASTKGMTPATSKNDHHRRRGYVEVMGMGSAKGRGRFVRVKVNGDKLLISTNDLLGSMIPVYARLQTHGASLTDPKDQKELWARIKSAMQEEDTFPVATRIGWFDTEDAQGKRKPPVFVLPHGAIPEKQSAVEVHLDEPDNDCYSRIRTRGTLNGATEWLKLCDGNKSAMFGLSLACLGPVGSYLGLEHVGIALVSGAGKLKTILAAALASFYGGDDDPLNHLASGASLRQTGFNVEKFSSAYSGLMLVLDEGDAIEGNDRRAKDHALFSLIKDVAQGVGKGRGTNLDIARFYAPLVVTTNESVAAVAKRIGRRDDFSFIDRMFDVVLPEGAACFFENLHGSANPTKFRERLVKLLREHYGQPGWEFIRRLAKWIRDDELEFKAFVRARTEAYRRLASKIQTPGRDPTRLHNKFAFVYAAGCAGIKLGILPFRRKSLLQAILCCERDHIAYVARELRLREGSECSAMDPFDAEIQKLARYLRRNRGAMVNLRKRNARLPPGHNHRSCAGYLGRHEGRAEMWVPFSTVKSIVGGGRSKMRALQDELYCQGLLWADEGPSGKREYSVKRDIRGVRRSRVLAFLYAREPAVRR